MSTLSENSVKPSADIMVRALGRGLASAIFYSIIFCDCLVPLGSDAILSYNPRLIYAALFLAAALVSLFWFMGSRHGMFRKIAPPPASRLILWSSIILAVLGIFEFGLQYCDIRQFGIDLVVMLIAGVSTGLLTLAWASREAICEEGSIVSRCCISFLVFGACVLLMVLVTPEFRSIAVAIGALLSGAFSFFASDNVEDEELATSRRSEDKLKLHISTSVSYAGTSFVIAYMLFMYYISSGMPIVALVIGTSVLIAVVIVFFINYAFDGSRLLLGPVERLTLSIIVLCLLMVHIVPYPVSTACLIVAFAFLFLRDISRIITRILIAQEYAVSKIRFCARTIFPFISGMFLGVCFALFIASFSDMFVAQIGLALSIFILVLVSTISPYGSDLLIMSNEESKNNLAIDAQTDEDYPSQGAWKQACCQFAQEYSLTSREKEVMEMLSRGRSAAIIARDFSISVHTAKSHIYNVYHKMMVESQQDLIDMVEKRRNEIRSASDDPHARL